MNGAFQFIRGLVILVLVLSGVAWFMWRWLKNSADPSLLIFRWVFTTLILIGLAYEGRIAHENFVQGNKAAALIVGYAALGGMVLAVVWVPVITSAAGSLFGGFIDGGNVEVEAKPYYSAFRAKKQNGKYFEALAEVRRQLDKFPTDFDGQMLLAALQAENLDDLPGAAITIQKLCAQPGVSPQNLAYALNQLADWHLNLTKDRDSARATLEKIIELLPDTEMSLRAAQRIGHLANNDMLLSPHDRHLINVKQGVKNLGLLRGQDGRLKAPQVDQEKLAAEYVAQLEQHPQDTYAREQLAMIYAKHYHRLDLATEQLEQLIEQPGHPSKQVTGWLNVLADLQVAGEASQETVAATLQRIIELYPEQASAQKAQRRLDQLKLEFKGKEKTPAKQMGVYEQNLGLKRKT